MTPEFYRQKFRQSRISPDQTYQQFEFHLKIMLDSWLRGLNVNEIYRFFLIL